MAADKTSQASSRQVTPTLGGRTRQNNADSLAEKLATGSGVKERKNVGTLNTQLEIEKQRDREVHMKKALAKELNERYDRTFMSKK